MRDMDLDGIETAALFPSAALVLAAVTHRGVSCAFARIINDWIATYRELAAHQGEGRAWLAPKLALSRHSTFEEAQAAAEAIANVWQLGGVIEPGAAVEKRQAAQPVGVFIKDE